MIDRTAIENMIYDYVKKQLETNTPSYSPNEIKESISIFYDSILCKMNYAKLDGFSKQILVPLNNLANSKVQLTDLKGISTSLDAFFKRILILLGNPYNDVESKTLMPLLKQININTVLSGASNPQLKEETLENYLGTDEHLHSICLAYLTRNEVHNSPNWTIKELINRIEATLVVYIYTILRNSEIIGRETCARLGVYEGSILNDNENKWLYDFITYGKTAAELRTNVIDAFILNSTYDNLLLSTELTVADLNSNLNSKLGKSITSKFVGRRIQKLETEHKIQHNKERDVLSLTKEEVDRIELVRQQFKDNRDLFFMYFDEILLKYNIEDHKDELVEKLQQLLVDNYNLDFVEILKQEDNDSNKQYHICSAFIDRYLISILASKDANQAKELFKDLLNLGIHSDFLLSLSASSVFTNITDVEKYQQFINQPEKEVYLDTQVVLYSLCLDFRVAEVFDNNMFKISKELCKDSKKHQDVKLKFLSSYLPEIVFQLRNALGLIMFDAMFDYKFSGKLSTNVFYQYYSSLKQNNILDEDFHFSDFISECFSLEEGDLYDSSFQSICTNLVIEKLKELDYIEIETVEIGEVADIERIIDDVISTKRLSPKPYYVKNNDAKMISHLANEEAHTNNPFFLTWDKSFVELRKAYNSKFARRTTYKWHLFTPSKFVNHLALTNMKIEPGTLSDDFISLIDSFGLTDRTKTIFDNHTRFLDIRNISKDQRVKYIQILKDLFNDKEFCYESDNESDNIQNVNYGSALDAINSHFYESKTTNIDNYRQMLLDEKNFKEVAVFIKNAILSSTPEDSIMSFKKLCAEVETKVIEFVSEQKEKVNKDTPPAI